MFLGITRSELRRLITASALIIAVFVAVTLAYNPLGLLNRLLLYTGALGVSGAIVAGIAYIMNEVNVMNGMYPKRMIKSVATLVICTCPLIGCTLGLVIIRLAHCAI